MFCTLLRAGKFIQLALLGAVAAALEDAEILLPGADGAAVLMGEDARDLVDVGHVVDGPGGEKLGKRD